MNKPRIFLTIAGLMASFGVAAVIYANRFPEIASIEPTGGTEYDTAQLQLGEALTGIGACEVCHTAPNGAPFAGGLPLPTPFGTIYSTNITPDVVTGIGSWSEEAFQRAMRVGIDRNGRHLYPAFPYDHFTRATDEDIRAIYAHLMTLDPVTQEPPANDLPFPFNIRMLMAGWNLLFLEAGEYEFDDQMDDEWNRGAYLAEGLGHCGACHSPRNLLGAVNQAAAYDGAEAEEWHAPALNDTSGTPVPWSQLQLVNYLFDGWDELHGIAAGPMAPVVNHLYDQSEDDIFAIAAYIESLQSRHLSEPDLQSIIDDARSRDWEDEFGYRPAEIPDDPGLLRGMDVFADQCSKCHKRGSGQVPVSLALTGTVNAPDPRNVIHIIFDGIRPPRGALQRSMPGFGSAITDDDIVDLLKFMRWHFTDLPPWQDTDELVAEKRAHW